MAPLYVRRPYGTHPDQFGHLYSAGPDAPVAAVIHGGFWRARYDLTLMDGLCADLVAHGWSAWNIEYRRVGTGGGFPATCEDVLAAIAALDHNVVTIGHSAGGHLALWAAARSPHVIGAVGQAAVSDLRAGIAADLGAGIVREFVGGGDIAAASPIELGAPGVPTLLVHGERDDTVPASQSIDYAAMVGADECELVLRPRDGHFEHIDPSSAAWAAVIAWLQRFGP